MPRTFHCSPVEMRRHPGRDAGPNRCRQDRAVEILRGSSLAGPKGDKWSCYGLKTE
jgi:hypothetical protein